MRKLTEAILRSEFGDALRLCAEDAGTWPKPPSIVRADVHHKSILAYVAVEPSASQPSHVIKIDEGRWNPEREFGGLSYAAQVFDGTQSAGPYRLGSVAPVGYGRDPAYLVSRYQPSRPILPTFDGAVHALRRDSLFGEACAYSQALAEWLTRFRTNGVRPGEGPGVEGTLASCREHAEEIRHFLGAESVARAVTGRLERLFSQLTESDRQRANDTFPSHGDLAPQNFNVDQARILYAFDFESFRYLPMAPDLGDFRRRLEHYALRGPLARMRSCAVWQSFYSAYTSGPSSAGFALVCYLHSLLAHLAWQRNPQRVKLFGAYSFRTGVRVRLWIRQRLRWLSGLQGDIEADAAYFRNTL